MSSSAAASACECPCLAMRSLRLLCRPWPPLEPPPSRFARCSRRLARGGHDLPQVSSLRRRRWWCCRRRLQLHCLRPAHSPVWPAMQRSHAVLCRNQCRYANLCADMVRAALKEPLKAKAKVRRRACFCFTLFISFCGCRCCSYALGQLCIQPCPDCCCALLAAAASLHPVPAAQCLCSLVRRERGPCRPLLMLPVVFTTIFC